MINHAVSEIMETSKVFREKVQCMRCGWSWVPRKPEPISCPHCKSYEWKKEKVK